jgi:serine/threonine protein kinase
VSSPSELVANSIGDLVDHYGDVERLGDGAEGGAFGATERATGRRVVLKRVPPEQARAVRFAFGVLRRAGSPHLPAPRALLTSGDGSGWLITDWVAGSPLAVARASKVAEALAEGRAVAHALAAIHGAGTHHGDVAPGNVIVTPTGGVVLVDLGQLGRLGMGTPGFLAPEVLAGGGGPAADRFSLGCLLCMRLLGEPPWRRPEALLEVRDGAGVQARLQALGAGELDPPVRALLARLLDPRPEQRIADPGQLVAHLGRLHAAAEAGLDLRRAEPWWQPARWPYQGPSLAGVVERMLGP